MLPTSFISQIKNTKYWKEINLFQFYNACCPAYYQFGSPPLTLIDITTFTMGNKHKLLAKFLQHYVGIIACPKANTADELVGNASHYYFPLVIINTHAHNTKRANNIAYKSNT